MTISLVFVVTSHDVLGSSGNRSGSWLEEIAVPWRLFSEAGYRLSIASPKGGAAPIDPMSIEPGWISDAGRRFLADPQASAAIADTQPLDSVDGDAHDAIFLVGGTATTWDFPHNSALKRLVERHVAREAVVAAICHGVIGLISALDPQGEPLIKNRRLTAISNAEDFMMGVDKMLPVLPEDMIRKLRGLYSCAGPATEHVVCEPPLFTGQNPASAGLLARSIVDHFARR